MLANLRPAAVMIALFTLLLGGAYPLAITGVAQTLLRSPANGSLIRSSQSEIVGSALIGQGFTRPKYLHGRPSAAGAGYDPTSSSGSNYGPLDSRLADRVHADAAAIAAAAPHVVIPPDAVTTSGSGLDPDVSPETAALQAPRIAAARRLSVARVQGVIDAHTQGRTLLVFGEPRVNVLAVNLALDALPSGGG